MSFVIDCLRKFGPWPGWEKEREKELMQEYQDELDEYRYHIWCLRKRQRVGSRIIPDGISEARDGDE